MGKNFWQGLLWGSVLGTALGAVIGPMARPQKKPFVERGADAVISTTRGLMKEARKTRKRLMKKMD